MLTPQQSRHLECIQRQSRTVISGSSGTGKTLLTITYARQLAQSGKHVLFLVYNSLLTDDIRWALKDSELVTVLHYHKLYRQAVTALDTLFRMDIEWLDIAAPKALADAIARDMVPHDNALILDEAQVFDTQWLTALERWFSKKPILACCDEKQVFSFEHHTSLHDLEEIMQAQAFMLTTNIRSPYIIFERLQHVLQSRYDQYSPRPEEPDVLQEIATLDPLAMLCAIIQQLHTEGISSSSIMVIYTGKQKSAYPKGTRPLIPTTYSVFRSRGLESPVVIVWNNHEIDDTALTCAYSRATSRCIAIYSANYL